MYCFEKVLESKSLEMPRESPLESTQDDVVAIKSCHILSYPVISCHVFSYPAETSHILLYLLISCHILSHPIISCHILYGFIPFGIMVTFGTIWYHLVYPVISCPNHISSHPVISYYILSYSVSIDSIWGELVSYASIWNHLMPFDMIII